MLTLGKSIYTVTNVIGDKVHYDYEDGYSKTTGVIYVSSFVNAINGNNFKPFKQSYIRKTIENTN